MRGPFGKNLQAAAGNEVAAEAFGVSVPGYLTAAFVVSSAAIAFAGALAAPRIRILDPESFGVMLSIFTLAYPIVGGMHSIWGGLLGGGGLRVLPELLRPVADYQELFFATLVIVVVMFFPGGLVELLRRASALVVRRGGSRALPPTPAAASRPPAGTQASASHAVLLRVAGIDKHFGALHAVNSTSINVHAGGIHGLIGPNGAGKTSLFNIISGFLDADAGRIEFAGTSLLELQARDRIRLGITRTFQHVAVFGQLSCLDNVMIGRGRNAVLASTHQSFEHFIGGPGAAAARREALAALQAVGLADHAHFQAAALSLGEQRRLEIARAIVSQPKLILLDEPVSGVSEAEAEELHALLLRINAEHGIAMLVVEHNIPFVAKLCRSLSVMGAGCDCCGRQPRRGDLAAHRKATILRRGSCGMSAPESALRVTDLRVAYGQVVAVHGLTLTVGAGDALVLLGPNGAGKTSAVEAIAGLLPKRRRQGGVSWRGHFRA